MYEIRLCKLQLLIENSVNLKCMIYFIKSEKSFPWLLCFRGNWNYTASLTRILFLPRQIYIWRTIILLHSVQRSYITHNTQKSSETTKGGDFHEKITLFFSFKLHFSKTYFIFAVFLYFFIFSGTPIAKTKYH